MSADYNNIDSIWREIWEVMVGLEVEVCEYRIQQYVDKTWNFTLQEIRALTRPSFLVVLGTACLCCRKKYFKNFLYNISVDSSEY